MASTFPLYDNLRREASSTDLLKKEKEEFVKMVKKIDVEGSELFYAIVRCHQLQEESSEMFSHPYDSKLVKGALKFELENFPPLLKRMLFIFLKKHSLKMKEEEETRPV